MTERRVSLDIGTPGAKTSGNDSSGMRERSRDEPDRAVVDDFRARVASGEAAADASAAQAAPSPFGLLGSSALRGDAPDSRRLHIVDETVERLLVSDGSGGGAAEVRIALKDDLLPGVELRVAEREGELRFEFVASDPESAAWLAAQCESIASELCQRLRREVRVLVRRDEAAQGELLAEHLASAAPASSDGPASLFAGRMTGKERE